MTYETAYQLLIAQTLVESITGVPKRQDAQGFSSRDKIAPSAP